MANSFAVQLKNKSLIRGEDYRYTTGDEQTDHLLGLDNKTGFGNPESSSQLAFAGIVYLNGLFGRNCTSFTAVPFGFLCELGNEQQSGCYLVAEGETRAKEGNFLDFLIDDLINYILEYKNNNKLTKLEKSFCDFVISKLQTCSEVDFIEVVQLISANLNKTEGLDSFKQNSERSKKIYDDANQKNCDDNHIIFKNIIGDRNGRYEAEKQNCDKVREAQLKNLGIDPSLSNDEVRKKLKGCKLIDKINVERTLSKQESLEGKVITYDKMMSWVLDGYYTHRGYDPNGNQLIMDRGILNKRLAKSNVEKLLGSNFAEVLNICTTDYVADRVADVINLCMNNTDEHSPNFLNDAMKYVVTDKSNFSDRQAARKVYAKNHSHTI